MTAPARPRPEVHGVLNLFKPAGMTSHDVVDAVRKILGIRRVGHTGTLDPQATGVLPVCVGRATRVAQYLTQADKEYVMTLRLGVTTDTLDAAGKETGRAEAGHVTREDLLAVLPRFRGEIQQVPPIYSAKKVQGERLYRLARRGQTVERPPVAVRVHVLELLDFRAPLATLKAVCSKGTYARSLCDDIGRALGCGGHLQDLVRTRAGRFALEDAVTLPALEERVATGRLGEVLQPMGEALAHLPAIRVAPEAGPLILHGRTVPASLLVGVPEEAARGGVVRVLGFRKQLLALAELLLGREELAGGDAGRPALRAIRVFGG
ncbi:MAG: tRNA pseudouridine(55) synthase TruB [Candidatus Methylomirabilales bacterium]